MGREEHAGLLRVDVPTPTGVRPQGLVVTQALLHAPAPSPQAPGPRWVRSEATRPLAVSPAVPRAPSAVLPGAHSGGVLGVLPV